MLHFALVALILHATSALITTTTNAHYSEALRIKCQALPFRSVYLETNCYFAIEVDSNGAAKQCSSILAGSKFTGTAPDAVWSSLFVDKSKFLRDSDSRSAKKAMCMYESKFKCVTGTNTLVPGKCIHTGENKMNYRQAETFCARVGSLFSPHNDLENRMVAAATKSPAWLSPSYSKTWSDKTDFSRFGTCAASPFSVAKNPEWCTSNVAIAANPNGTSGYWALAGQDNLLDVLCVREADSEFWTAAPKRKPKPVEGCKDNHVWDEKTWQCEWTGPADACVQLLHVNGKKGYIRIPKYPNSTIPGVHVQLNLVGSVSGYEDATTRVIVRRGCIASFFRHRRYNDVHDELKMMRNVEYGSYFLPTASNGAIEGADGNNGLSRVTCYCDSYETEKTKPARVDCVEHHEWNERKKRCVWKLDDKYAGEIESTDGKKLMLAMPNWPFEKHYDVNLKDASLPDFLYKVTRIIVRQGCFCTIYSGYSTFSYQPRTTIGYGAHDVGSKFAKKPLAKLGWGSMRVVCECMNDDGEEERLIRTPEKPRCVELHEYNEQTRRCEWTGPAQGCAQLINTRKEKIFVELGKGGDKQGENGIQRFYKSRETLLTDAQIKDWYRMLTSITVRRGCMVDVFVAQHWNVPYKEYKILKEAKYGVYHVPQKSYGDVEGSYIYMGASQVNCVCDQALLSLTPAPPSTPCVDGHQYDHYTGQCEWTREKQICAVISNDKGQTMDVIIENYPLEMRHNWNIAQSRWYVKNATLFINRVVSVLVRQHCFVNMYPGMTNIKNTLFTSGYGIHTPTKGTARVTCECVA